MTALTSRGRLCLVALGVCKHTAEVLIDPCSSATHRCHGEVCGLRTHTHTHLNQQPHVSNTNTRWGEPTPLMPPRRGVSSCLLQGAPLAEQAATQTARSSGGEAQINISSEISGNNWAFRKKKKHLERGRPGDKNAFDRIKNIKDPRSRIWVTSPAWGFVMRWQIRHELASCTARIPPWRRPDPNSKG